jgi:hypothetical protein
MPRGDQREPYDLIIIGRGTAAAAYILTIPRQYRSLGDEKPLPLTTLVIGRGNNWSARGDTPGSFGANVNQSKQVDDFPDGATASVSHGPLRRKEWVDKTARILREFGDEVVDATVLSVTKVLPSAQFGPELFKVESDDKKARYGSLVVFATGAGIESPPFALIGDSVPSIISA